MKKIKIFTATVIEEGLSYMELIKEFDNFVENKKQPQRQERDYDILKLIDKANPSAKYKVDIVKGQWNCNTHDVVRMDCSHTPTFIASTIEW